MADVEPGVVIGLKEIYDKLIEVDKKVDSLPHRVDRLEDQVATLRARVYWLGGLAAAGGTLVGAILPKLIN